MKTNGKLTNDEKERIKEIYSWGYFMDRVMKYKCDADGKELSDETILLLIDAEENTDLFSEYEYESNPCESCGSHGTESVLIGNTRVTIVEW